MKKNRKKDMSSNPIKRLMEATGYYVLSLASTYTDDKDLIYKISYETYMDMMSKKSTFDSEEKFITYISKTVNEKANLILKKSYVFNEIESVNFDANIKDIDLEKIEKEFDNPKSQNIIYDSIGKLSDCEREVVFRVYFCDEDIDSIASIYNVSSEVINNYLSKAQKELDKSTKNYFLKNKILNQDYSRMFLIYSGIKLGKKILTLNLKDLLIDQAMDGTISKVLEKGIDKIADEDGNETNLENFISKILKDILLDWINDGIKGVVRFGIIKAKALTSSTATIGAKEVTKVGAKAFLKTTFGKAVVTVLSVAVVGVSGVEIGKVVQENHYQKVKEEILSEEPYVSSIGSFDFLASTGVTTAIPFKISFFTDENNEEVKYISLDLSFKSAFMSEAELKTYDFALSLIDGLDASYENLGDYISFNAIIDKEDLNQKLIEFLTNNNMLDDEMKTLVNDIINADCENIVECLESHGYKCQ